MALRDKEYFDFPADLGNANVPVKRGLSGKLRRVRRKPGLEQLSVQGNDAATPSLPKKGYIRVSIRSDSTTSAAGDIVTKLAQEGPRSVLQGSEQRKHMLEQQRELWETTLPRLPVDHIGYFSSGHGLDQTQLGEVM